MKALLLSFPFTFFLLLESISRKRCIHAGPGADSRATFSRREKGP
jgi:hypothetical protein